MRKGGIITSELLADASLLVHSLGYGASEIGGRLVRHVDIICVLGLKYWFDWETKMLMLDEVIVTGRHHLVGIL